MKSNIISTHQNFIRGLAFSSLVSRLLQFSILTFLFQISFTLTSIAQNKPKFYSATINGFTYTRDDSTAVTNHLVRLKNSLGVQIDSVLTGTSNNWQFINVPNEVNNENAPLPSSFMLYQNFPNPFNPHTTIRYEVSTGSTVTIDVFDIKGEKITTLVNEYKSPGRYEVQWDAITDRGSQTAEGVYLVRMSANGNQIVKKMIFLHKSVTSQSTTQSLRKNYFQELSVTYSLGYEIEVVNLGGTVPQIADTQFTFVLSGDTTINVYVNRVVFEPVTVDVTSLVQMLSGNVPGKYQTVQLKQGANIIDTKSTGDSGKVHFLNVPRNANYTVSVIGDTASRPNISQKDTLLWIDKDTAIVVNPSLYLRPTTMSALENKTFNEDEYPANPILHDLWTKVNGYDSLGNAVGDNLNSYLVVSQSNPQLAPTIIQANQYAKLDGLLANGNGQNSITVRATSPNQTSADRTFAVDIKALADIILNAKLQDGTPVVNFKAEVKNNSGQIFHTQYSGNNSQMILNNMPQPVKQIDVKDTDSSASFTPYSIIFVNPFDRDTSLVATLIKDERKVTLNFVDYFLNTAVNNVYVKTSKEAGTNTGGKQWRAGFNEEKIVANGPAHLRSGIVLAPGSRDTTILHYLVNADVNNQGLDTVYLKGLLTLFLDGGYRYNPITSDFNGKFVSLTPTSVKDTIWIYGLIPPVSQYKFRDVGQLNEIAKVLNDTAKAMTTTKDFPNGLFGVDKRIIAIADSNFNKPDSIAKFLYSNMKVVPQSTAPIDLETISNYIWITAGAGTGGNAPKFKEDGLTLRGGFVTINSGLSNSAVNKIAKEELLSMLMGSVEIQGNYPSIFATLQGSIFPQDKRLFEFVTYRFNQTSGRQFPDLPPNF